MARLALTNFRNYREAKLALGARPCRADRTQWRGKNQPARSPLLSCPWTRFARREIERGRPPVGHTATIHRLKRPGWAVAAAIATRAGMVRIGTGRDPEEGERRIVRIDGEPARSQAALGEQLGVVWLTPPDGPLVCRGRERATAISRPACAGARPRARYADRHYEQAMRERARLLRDGPADPGWLAAVEAVMAAQGVAIAAARRDMCNGSTPFARMPKGCSRAPASRCSAPSRTGSTRCPRLTPR